MGVTPNIIKLNCLACNETAVIKRDEDSFCIECYIQVEKIRNGKIFSEIRKQHTT